MQSPPSQGDDNAFAADPFAPEPSEREGDGPAADLAAEETAPAPPEVKAVEADAVAVLADRGAIARAFEGCRGVEGWGAMGWKCAMHWPTAERARGLQRGAMGWRGGLRWGVRCS